jgi:peroxiredoxin Q/BCP
MIRLFLLVLFAAVLFVLVRLLRAGRDRAAVPPPRAGDPAPDFTLPDQSGHPVRLSDFHGRWVVLYFYPKDFTAGCSVEARNFQRDLAGFEQRGAVILGVSGQDVRSHGEFCRKEGLNFRLLADSGGAVSRQWGSLLDLSVLRVSSRHTFLIDPEGRIAQAWLSVNPLNHSREVLTALEAKARE